MLYSSNAFSKNSSFLDQIRSQAVMKNPHNRSQDNPYDPQQSHYVRANYVQQGRLSQSRMTSHHSPDSQNISDQVYKLSNLSALKGSRKALPNFFNDVVNLRASLEPDRKQNLKNDHIIYEGPQKHIVGLVASQRVNQSQRNLITANSSQHYSSHQERIKRSLSGQKTSQSPPGHGSQGRLSSIEIIKNKPQLNKGPSTTSKVQYFADSSGRVPEQRTTRIVSNDGSYANNNIESSYRIRKASKIEKPSTPHLQTFEDQSAQLYDITPKFSLAKKDTPRDKRELSDTPTTKSKYSPLNFTKSSHILMHMGSVESNETVKISHPARQAIIEQYIKQQTQDTNYSKQTLKSQPSVISKQFDELSVIEQTSNISQTVNIDPKTFQLQIQQGSPSPVESNMNESQQLGLEEFHNKYSEEIRDLNASLPQITVSDPKAPLKWSKSYNNPKSRNEESSENLLSSDQQNSQKEIHSADKPQKKGILKFKDVSQNYIQLIKRENPQFKSYLKQYEDAFESLNQIGQCVALSMDYLKAKSNFWIIPLFLTFKRLAQLRTEAELNLMQRSNLYNFDDWEEFSNTKEFTDMCKRIKCENDIIEVEMGKLKQLAQKMSNKLEKARKIKVEWFINEELNQNIKDTSFIYLYSQLLQNVRHQISNPKGNPQVEKVDWLKLALMMQFCLIVFESPLMKYELLDVDHFKKVTTDQDPDEMEEQMGIYDEILNGMKQRLVKAGYKI